VPQDWGGPIGLSWAVAHPQRAERLFILNTFAHRPPWKVPIPLPLRLFRAPGAGELLVKGLNMFVRGFLFRVGVTHPERLTAPVHRAYLAPHPGWDSRTAMLAFPRQIPSGPDGPVSELAARLEGGLRRHFADRPVAIAWGMKDPAPHSGLSWRDHAGRIGRGERGGRADIGRGGRMWSYGCGLWL
jgi:pimeloyl-ACP methyl ester carboxylesterase